MCVYIYYTYKNVCVYIYVYVSVQMCVQVKLDIMLAWIYKYINKISVIVLPQEGKLIHD